MESVGQHLSSSERRSLPQIARMSTDIGIYKICENPWNLWDNISHAASGGVSHRCHRLTRIFGAKEFPTDIADEHGYLVRRSFPQMPQINTDIGCEGEHKLLEFHECVLSLGLRNSCDSCYSCSEKFRICVYLRNLWANNLKQQMIFSRRYHRISQIKISFALK